MLSEMEIFQVLIVFGDNDSLCSMVWCFLIFILGKLFSESGIFLLMNDLKQTFFIFLSIGLMNVWFFFLILILIFLFFFIVGKKNSNATVFCWFNSLTCNLNKRKYLLFLLRPFFSFLRFVFPFLMLLVLYCFVSFLGRKVWTLKEKIEVFYFTSYWLVSCCNTTTNWYSFLSFCFLCLFVCLLAFFFFLLFYF
jgi:hypothetical protein